MYVEAFKESHVAEAVRGLRNVLISRGVRLVPLKEMVDAITVNTKAKKNRRCAVHHAFSEHPWNNLCNPADVGNARRTYPTCLF